MSQEAKIPLMVRVPVTLYDQLKAYQFTESKQTTYRVTLQGLALRAIQQMLNEKDVTPAQVMEDVEGIIREHLDRSTRYLSEPSTYAQAAERVNFFVTTFTKEGRLLQSGSSLRAEVEEHLARWDAMRG